MKTKSTARKRGLKYTATYNANKWAHENAVRFPPKYEADPYLVEAMAEAFMAGVRWRARRG